MYLKKLANKHYTEIGIVGGSKISTWQCNYCKKTRKHHTTRMLEHLSSECHRVSEEVQL